jgi:hypothetical protein
MEESNFILGKLTGGEGTGLPNSDRNLPLIAHPHFEWLSVPLGVFSRLG